jgi:hypothetical protein
MSEPEAVRREFRGMRTSTLLATGRDGTVMRGVLDQGRFNTGTSVAIPQLCVRQVV